MHMFNWLKIRKKIIIAIFVDIFLMSLFFANFSNLSQKYEFLEIIQNYNLIDIFYLSLSWIILSYICGRYSNLENITLKNKLFRNIIRSLITSFLFIIIFFIGNLFLKRDLNLKEFYPLIIYLNTSILAQYLLTKIRIFSGEKIRKILIIYDDDSYDELYSFFDEINKKTLINLFFMMKIL